MPRHLAIIMDGNGRWAKKRSLPRSAGHKQGAKAFREIARHCKKIGIEYLTVYAFSTENWKRPKEEVDAIMDLLRDYLNEISSHTDEDGRINFIGDTSPLADDLKEQISQVTQRTRDRSGMTINIALNYGGQEELVMATRSLAERVRKGEITPKEIDREMLQAALYTAGQPDVDCIIRPSGEKRISGFLLWQAAYAELIFMDTLWPDFTHKHLDTALEEYSRRNRRFGGI